MSDEFQHHDRMRFPWAYTYMTYLALGGLSWMISTSDLMVPSVHGTATFRRLLDLNGGLEDVDVVGCVVQVYCVPCLDQGVRLKVEYLFGQELPSVKIEGQAFWCGLE